MASLDFDRALFPGLFDERVCVCHGNWTGCPLCHGTGRPCLICKGTGFVAVGEDQVKACQCNSRRAEILKMMPAGLKNGMELWTFEGLDERYADLAKKLKEWATRPQGWLLVLGPPGRGKSFVLAAMTNQARANSREACYWMASMFLDEVQERRLGGGEGLSFPAWWRKVMRLELILLDEFGNHSDTDARHEKLRELLVSRSDPDFRPTVLASDADFGRLEQRFPWLASRLHHESVRLVDLTSYPDMRRTRHSW